MPPSLPSAKAKFPKKNSYISDDELYETTEQIVDSTPDTITTENDDQDPTTPDTTVETTVTDENPVTSDSETPVVENTTPDATDETPVVDEQNPTSVLENPTPDATVETPVADEQKPVTVVEKPTTDTVKTPVDKGIGNKTQNNVEPVKIDEFKRFYIRFGYSIDSRSTTTRRTLSTTEIVKQFVKAPTCFIAFETKEDLKDFETLLKIKTIKVEDKEGKLVDFPDAAKKHLIERVTELSKYWISRNSK